jgi:hypothetical protein
MFGRPISDEAYGKEYFLTVEEQSMVGFDFLVRGESNKGPANACFAEPYQAGDNGFEPLLTDPESVVLPLHQSPVKSQSG